MFLKSRGLYVKLQMSKEDKKKFTSYWSNNPNLTTVSEH